MKKIIIFLSLFFILFSSPIFAEDLELKGKAHVQDIGWMEEVTGQDIIIGTIDQAKRLESIAISTNNPNVKVQVSVHVQDIGWMKPVINTEAGTVGQAKQIEALKLKLVGSKASSYSISYRAYIENLGWQKFVSDGAVAGTVGKALRCEALEIKISNKNKVTTISDNNDFARKISKLVKENRVSIGSSIAADDPFFTKRIIVKLKDKSAVDWNKYKTKEIISNGDNLYIVQFSSNKEAKTALTDISKLTNVEYAEPDTYSGTQETAGVKALDSWGTSKIGAPSYAKTVDSNVELKVAVVDTGVSNHVFINDRITDGIDLVDNDSNPTDLNGHGTHVSGTIVDCTPNLNVKIQPIRVLDANGDGTTSIVGLGVRYAADNGAKVINMSLGGGHNAYLDECINYAVSKGVTVCVAAGNEYGDTSWYCPSHLDNVIVVGAVDINDSKAAFSNVGDSLDVVAPGVNITSSYLDNTYKSLDGTSMATPHVSAIAAMYAIKYPDSTPAQIENLVRLHVRDLGESGWDRKYGAGIPYLVETEDSIEPTDVIMDPTHLELQIGQESSISTTVLPEDADNKSLSWSSSDPSIVSVNDSGILTAKKAGSAEITAKTFNDKTATCLVSVSGKEVEPTRISIDKSKATINVNESVTLKATVYPENAVNKQVYWSSSELRVAQVVNGVVVGYNRGQATITASTPNGKKATCRITVVDDQAGSDLHVQKISGGGAHYGVILDDQSLRMWGGNVYGQIGNGETSQDAVNYPIKIMDDVKSVELDGDSSAAIKTDGTLWTWGYNPDGRLGDNKSTNRSLPQKIMDDVEAVNLKGDSGLVIKKDHSLWMWGWLYSDQKPQKFEIPTKILDNVVQAEIGNYYYAALKEDGSVWIWGSQEHIFGNETSKSAVPIKVMDDVSQIAANSYSMLALKNDGTLISWGKGTNGCLGNGSSEDSTTPIKVMENVQQISSSGDSCVALKKDGTVWTWGDNSNAQLGNGESGSRINPTPQRIAESATEIFSLHESASFISTDKELYFWGTMFTTQYLDEGGLHSSGFQYMTPRILPISFFNQK